MLDQSRRVIDISAGLLEGSVLIKRMTLGLLIPTLRQPPDMAQDDSD